MKEVEYAVIVTNLTGGAQSFGLKQIDCLMKNRMIYLCTNLYFQIKMM